MKTQNFGGESRSLYKKSVTTYSSVSTSIKAHNFVRLPRGTLSISVASTPQHDLFSKKWYSERFPQCSRAYITVVSPHRETRFHYAAERARDVLYRC